MDVIILRSGQFQDIDELLTKALDALSEPTAPTAPPPRQNLHEFFMSSPLRRANLNLERKEDFPRALELR